jgi:hypothetical protein
MMWCIAEDDGHTQSLKIEFRIPLCRALVNRGEKCKLVVRVLDNARSTDLKGGGTWQLLIAAT